MKSELKTAWGSGRLAGTKVETYFRGDVVQIYSGEDVGYEAEVLDVIGHVYSADNKIVIRSPNGELVYYFPWDVRLVSRR